VNGIREGAGRGPGGGIELSPLSGCTGALITRTERTSAEIPLPSCTDMKGKSANLRSLGAAPAKRRSGTQGRRTVCVDSAIVCKSKISFHAPGATDNSASQPQDYYTALLLLFLAIRVEVITDSTRESNHHAVSMLSSMESP